MSLALFKKNKSHLVVFVEFQITQNKGTLLKISRGRKQNPRWSTKVGGLTCAPLSGSILCGGRREISRLSLTNPHGGEGLFQSRREDSKLLPPSHLS